MATIEVSHLVKAFGPLRAVDDISFSVEEGEILAIVGASGCGKTTTLRCLAGLERPTAGSVVIAGTEVASPAVFLPPEKRGIGMVFQSYALWPHKSVYDNIAYGLQIRKMPRAGIRDAVGRALDLVGLKGFEERFPATLSGGQQQRVALARSAVTEPKVLLLDEPLSNLDAKLREQMREDLRRMVKELRCTAVHITHDQVEAMTIADRIIYMRAGRIEQIGVPRTLYRQPANRNVAEFIGMATFLDGIVAQSGPDGVRVCIADGLTLVSATEGQWRPEEAVTVLIRPESVLLATGTPSGSVNCWPARIVQESFLGDRTEYLLDIAGTRLKAHSGIDLPVGAEVFAEIDPARAVCFPRKPGATG